MSPSAPQPPVSAPVPRVMLRATLGVGVALVALHSLAAGTWAPADRPSPPLGQVRLRLDPNVASREELMLLPRVGPTLADYIVEFRESMRPARAFHCPEDLDRVHRIGPATVAQLRPFLRFPPARAPDHAEAALP